jgi:hypothetical protein
LPSLTPAIESLISALNALRRAYASAKAADADGSFLDELEAIGKRVDALIERMEREGPAQ